MIGKMLLYSSNSLKKIYEATEKMMRSSYMISNLYFCEIIAIITFLNDWEKIPDLCIRNIYLEESGEGKVLQVI